MMRALAAVAASAAALVALPVTAGAESATVSESAAAGSASDSAASFLSTPSLFGMSVGAVLWLSVALVAMVAAGVMLRRTKSAAPALSDAADLYLAGNLRSADAPGLAG